MRTDCPDCVRIGHDCGMHNPPKALPNGTEVWCLEGCCVLKGTVISHTTWGTTLEYTVKVGTGRRQIQVANFDLAPRTVEGAEQMQAFLRREIVGMEVRIETLDKFIREQKARVA